MKQKKQHIDTSIPKDYFKDFEERLFIKLNEYKLSKKTGFTTPVGYFNTVEKQLLNKVKNKNEPYKVISIVSRKTLLYAATIAACALLILSIIPSKNKIETISDIDFASIESYIEEGNVTIITTDLTAMLNDDDFVNINSEIETFSDEIIELYLLDNTDDSSILIK